MPVQANPKQKTKRAFVARMLAQLTIGLGVCSGAALLAAPGFSQSCDRCAGLNSPSCGCEASNAKPTGPKPCGCSCKPKPSLGERILNHFDHVGDRLEAKAAKPTKGQCDPKPGSGLAPNCGCESPPSPSCDCGSCSTPKSVVRTPLQQSTLPPIARPFQGDSSRFATGSIGDKPLKETPTTPVSPKNAPQAKLGTHKPLITTPVAPTVPEPSVQRAPFEQKRSSTPTNRIPADETNQSVQTMPNTLKPVTSDPPPAWNANTPASRTPDVLVDPFKDDVSSRGTRDKMEGILLTSDRKAADNLLRLAPSENGAPAKLTPKQRGAATMPQVSELQFEAAGSDSVQGSQVVPSSYFGLVPVKTDLRKQALKSSKTEMPHVSKMRVPTKR